MNIGQIHRALQDRGLCNDLSFVERVVPLLEEIIRLSDYTGFEESGKQLAGEAINALRGRDE